MLNSVQHSTSNSVEYDVPSSTFGYPIYFSLYADDPLNKPNGSVRVLNSSSLTLPQPSRHVNGVLNNGNQFSTLPATRANDNSNLILNQNVEIPSRDFNFTDLLKLSDKSRMLSPGAMSDLPLPHLRSTIPFPPVSPGNGDKQPAVEPNSVQLVITENTNHIQPSLTTNGHLKENNDDPMSVSRRGSRDLSRFSLPRIRTSLPYLQPNVPFGSTTSLPSPISDPLSLETSISLSSCDNNNNSNNISTNCRNNHSNRSSLFDQSMLSETYDVPPNRDSGKHLKDSGLFLNCDTLTSRGSLSGFQRKTGFNMDGDKIYDTPSFGYASDTNNDFTEHIYEQPKPPSNRNNDGSSFSQRGHPVKAMTAITRSNSSNNNTSFSQLTSQNDYPIDADGLDLNLESGLILANRLENESLQAVGKLIDISSTECWRKRENLESRIGELSKCCGQLKCVVRELEVFTEGIYANSLRNPVSSINNKLHHLTRQMKDSAHIVISTIKSIDKRGWTVDELAPRRVSHDELDQLIACMPGLKEDIKHIMSMVKSHGNLLFPEKVDNQPTVNASNNSYNHNNFYPSHVVGLDSSSKSISTFGMMKSMPSKPSPPPVPPKPPIYRRPLPLVPKDNSSSGISNKAVPNIGKESLDRENRASTKAEEDKSGYEEDDDGYYAIPEINNRISQTNLSNSNISPASSSPCDVIYEELADCYNKETPTTQPQDHFKIDSKTTLDQLLSFYCPLLEEQNQNLRNYVNAMISAINTKQLPKELISLSKLVVISGQQMIFIGDTISRNVSGEISCYVAKCSNSLCDSLKNLINNTKKAANQFPAAAALQDLLDSIVQVSIHSDQLTLLKDRAFIE